VQLKNVDDVVQEMKKKCNYDHLTTVKLDNLHT